VRTIIKGKNYEVPDRVRRYAERKVGRLERLLDETSDAIVELSVEGRRSSEDSHLVDMTLVIDGRTVRGHAAAATHQAGIDEVLDKVERRAVDVRAKPRARVHGPSAADVEASGESSASVRPRPTLEVDGETDGLVVKTKRFAIEPMFEEDAVARMEELGHAFFVFVNAETERIAVLYRRRAGGYGLIEPVVGGGYTSGRGESSRGAPPARRGLGGRAADRR
jgi:putative sigma-54 modulation protein